MILSVLSTDPLTIFDELPLITAKLVTSAL